MGGEWNTFPENSNKKCLKIPLAMGNMSPVQMFHYTSACMTCPDNVARVVESQWWGSNQLGVSVGPTHSHLSSHNWEPCFCVCVCPRVSSVFSGSAYTSCWCSAEWTSSELGLGIAVAILLYLSLPIHTQIHMYPAWICHLSRFIKFTCLCTCVLGVALSLLSVHVLSYIFAHSIHLFVHAAISEFPDGITFGVTAEMR